MDGAIVGRFVEGDPDAVRVVYDTYGRLVLAVTHRILGDRGLAEEATQQTFVQAWRAAATFDRERELGPWLATIARRVAIDVQRREARRPTTPIDTAAADDSALVTMPPSVEQTEAIWEVRAAVDALASDEREVVRLQHMEQLSHVEIADRLGIPIGTVKSRSFRAHRSLASRLGHLRAPADEPGAEGRRTP